MGRGRSKPLLSTTTHTNTYTFETSRNLDLLEQRLQYIPLPAHKAIFGEGCFEAPTRQASKDSMYYQAVTY